MSNWLDTWSCMEQECREEALLLPFASIRHTLDGYLKKHSFCSECTNMVNKAYNLLVEEGQVSKDLYYFEKWLILTFSGACQSCW